MAELGLVGGIGLGFFIGLVVLSVYLLVTGTKRWHAKHHRDHADIMCDHCLRERGLM